MKRWESNFRLPQMVQVMKQEFGNTEENAPYPPEIIEWITQLKLLKEVPLSWLAGDEKQLPSESIRFFYVDERWTEQLVNGALSIGAQDSKSRCVNLFFAGAFHEEGRNQRYFPRERRIHEKQRIFCKRTGNVWDGRRLTGFLMRSRLTRLWKGLESTAEDTKGTALDILRMEQLSEEFLICVFNGEIDKLIIREPKEGLRFGTHETNRTIRVRDTVKGNEGKPLPGETTIIRTNAYGRADILSLTEELKTSLHTDCMTSAELAMELIIAPGLAEFHKKQEGDNDGFETADHTISG